MGEFNLEEISALLDGVDALAEIRIKRVAQNLFESIAKNHDPVFEREVFMDELKKARGLIGREAGIIDEERITLKAKLLDIKRRLEQEQIEQLILSANGVHD
jgi:hypothetical protein